MNCDARSVCHWLYNQGDWQVRGGAYVGVVWTVFISSLMTPPPPPFPPLYTEHVFHRKWQRLNVDVPARLRRWINAVLTMVHLLRRWTTVKSTLIKRFVSDRLVGNPSGSRTDCRRQNLTSQDVIFWRLNSIPTLTQPKTDNSLLSGIKRLYKHQV